MAAKKKEIRRVPGGQPAPRHRIAALYFPEKAKRTQMIDGSAPEVARELIRKLRDEARVIQ